MQHDVCLQHRPPRRAFPNLFRQRLQYEHTFLRTPPHRTSRSNTARASPSAARRRNSSPLKNAVCALRELFLDRRRREFRLSNHIKHRQPSITRPFSRTPSARRPAVPLPASASFPFRNPCGSTVVSVSHLAVIPERRLGVPTLIGARPDASRDVKLLDDRARRATLFFVIEAAYLSRARVSRLASRRFDGWA